MQAPPSVGLKRPSKLEGSGSISKVKTIIAIIAVAFILLACSRQEAGVKSAPIKTDGRGQVISNNRPPEVVSGVIVSETPTAVSPLAIQYIGHDADGDPIQYKFRWYVDGAIVQEGVDGTLQPGEYKKGSTVFAEIIPSDEFGSGEPFRTPAVTILNQPPVITAVNLTPIPVSVGMTVIAEVEGFDPDGDIITYLYQWKVNGKTKAADENINSLNTNGLRKGDVISVFVTPSDGEGSGKGIESGGVTLSNSAPQIVSSPPSLSGSMVYTYQVVAKDPDGDILSFNLAAAPHGMTINPSTGLVRWEVPKDIPHDQSVLVKIVVDDHDGGIAVQEFSLALGMK